MREAAACQQAQNRTGREPELVALWQAGKFLKTAVSGPAGDQYMVLFQQHISHGLTLRVPEAILQACGTAVSTQNQMVEIRTAGRSLARIQINAQEVETVMPEAVNSSGDYKSVDYDQLVPVLIEAVKQLKAEVDTLKSENAALRNTSNSSQP